MGVAAGLSALRAPSRRRQQNREYVYLNYGSRSEGVDGTAATTTPFWPYGWDYKVETLTAGWLIVPNQNPVPYPPPFPTGKYALTNYGGQIQGTPAAITYIHLITDYTQLMPGFVNCLAWRLAKELCVGVTEDKGKFELCDEDQYKKALNSSEAQNESSDYEHDEDGSDSWVRAGRNANVWGGVGGW